MNDPSEPPRRKGRAARLNPPNPFNRLHLEEDAGEMEEEDLRRVPTEFFRDTSRTILAKNNSPDIPFTFSLNPYRGCEHGCAYCYARPSHEYLGFSAGLDFETKIIVKDDAPRLLEEAFESKGWKPQSISLSGNTDPYQPVERKLKLTRRCLEVFARYRNPVSIITKNHLVTRDLDLLGELAAHDLVFVMLSITSLRPDLVGIMEPRTSRPTLRLRAVEKLASAGIPVGVMTAPVIPGLTDEEVPAILKAAAEAGATQAGYTIVRLPGAVKEVFTDWIRHEMPQRADRVLKRLADIRGESLNDSRFGLRMSGQGEWARTIDALFKLTCARLGLNQKPVRLTTDQFRRPPRGQLGLFG